MGFKNWSRRTVRAAVVALMVVGTAGVGAGVASALPEFPDGGQGQHPIETCWNQPYYPWIDGGEVTATLQWHCDVPMQRIAGRMYIDNLDPGVGTTRQIWSTFYAFPETHDTGDIEIRWDAWNEGCEHYTHYRLRFDWYITAEDGTQVTGERKLPWTNLGSCRDW